MLEVRIEVFEEGHGGGEEIIAISICKSSEVVNRPSISRSVSRKK